MTNKQAWNIIMKMVANNNKIVDIGFKKVNGRFVHEFFVEDDESQYMFHIVEVTNDA